MPSIQYSCVYVVMYCSLAKSGRLICIGRRSSEFRFAMLTSVRAKRFTGSSGKTSLDLSKMFFKDRLLGLWKMAVLLHEVAAGKLLLIVTSSIIISCVKPHYFRSAFRPTFRLSQLLVKRVAVTSNQARDTCAASALALSCNNWARCVIEAKLPLPYYQSRGVYPTSDNYKTLTYSKAKSYQILNKTGRQV